MTECGRCGDCCDPISVRFDPQERAAKLLASDDLSDINRHNAEFMRDHWRSTSTFEIEEDGETITVHRVLCDAFDQKARLCTAHENRPPVCWGYPWYGRPPSDPGCQPQAASLSPRCSFNADVPGRRMLPLVEVR